MLNRAERYWIIVVIRCCCTLGVLPVEVNLAERELRRVENTSNWKCRFWFTLTIFHAMYKMTSLASAYFLEEDTPLHEMVIHAMIAFTAPMYIYWYYLIYFKYPVVFCVYASMTLNGNIGETAAGDKTKRSWLLRINECTPQDLFAMSLPFIASSAIGAIIVALMFHPSLKLLLYAATPKEYQTWVIFALLMLEESRFLVNLVSIGIPVWILQVISFDLVNNQLQLLIKSMQRRSLEDVYVALRRIQAYVGIVNLINRFAIFSWKVLCITASIGAGYAAIAHFDDYPLFGVMYYICVLDCSFMYIFAYGNAFKIPELFAKSKQTAGLRLRNGRSQASKIFKLQMRSIPRVGIKVGEFHMMERESTIIFVDYVLNNIVSMLVANRHD